MNSFPYLETAVELSQLAGEIMRKNFTLNMTKEWKEDLSSVTATDLAINDLVLKEIKLRYPDHSILSEEGSDHDSSHMYVWICDPVDGTHNFSHGIPTATFAIALLEHGEPILSVVYDPFLDRRYIAEKGKGATLNGQPIHVGGRDSLKKSLMGMGKMKGVKNLIPVYEEARGRGAQFITGLSTHYMCALVAAGEFSASFFGGTSPHDIAASALLVQEAGGKVTDFFGVSGGRYDGERQGLLVSNGSVHDELLAIMEQVG